MGLFLLFALGAILTGVFFIGNIRLFKRTVTYYIDFQDVEALPPKAAVKVAGVEVGKVKRVQLADGHARVTIHIDPKLGVYENARGSIGSTGIIGTRFVELKPGDPQYKKLEPGATIRGEDGKSINEMVSKLSTLFEDDEQYGNAVKNLKATLANIRNVSESLNQALGQHGQELEEIVLNVRDLTQSIKVFSRHLEEISTERKDDVKVTLERFRGVSEKLDALLAKLSRGEGTLGTLIADDKAGQEVKEAITSIKDTAASAKKVLGRFAMINTYWNYRMRYDFRDSEARSDAGITIVPRSGKFYAVGVTNIGESISDEKNRAYERKNRITAVMGADWGAFTGYAGAIRSDGGVGLNFRPLWFSPKWNRRLELTAEAMDFSRDRVVNGDKLDRAFVALGGHFAVQRWLWIGARVEDVLERAAFMAYTNIVFRDEDLAYLLGFASVAR